MNDKQPRAYLAGPMRGYPQYNYPAFWDAAQKLRDAGWFIFSPAEMDVEEDGENYQDYDEEMQQLHDTAANARRFARRDLDVILNKLHAEHGDAIIVLPGWEKSTGALAETAMAKWVFLPRYTVEEAIDKIQEVR